MISEQTIAPGAGIDKHECGDNERIKPLEVSNLKCFNARRYIYIWDKKYEGIVDGIKYFSENNKSSSPLSSAGSEKLSSGEKQDPDSSVKDDSDSQTAPLDATYDKIDTGDASHSEDVNEFQDINESEFVTDQNSLELMTTKDFEENSAFDPAIWLHRTFIQFTSKFDSSSLFVDSDSKIDNLTMEESRLIYENMDDCWIIRARNYLADYQATLGTPREEYNFCTLIKLLGHASGHSLQALYTFILNIVPVLEIFLHIIRFILDKAISIKSAKDAQNMFINSVVFAVELIIIYICINVIFGYIISPVIRIPFGIIGKMLLYT